MASLCNQNDKRTCIATSALKLYCDVGYTGDKSSLSNIWIKIYIKSGNNTVLISDSHGSNLTELYYQGIKVIKYAVFGENYSYIFTDKGDFPGNNGINLRISLNFVGTDLSSLSSVTINNLNLGLGWCGGTNLFVKDLNMDSHIDYYTFLRFESSLSGFFQGDNCGGQETGSVWFESALTS